MAGEVAISDHSFVKPSRFQLLFNPLKPVARCRSG